MPALDVSTFSVSDLRTYETFLEQQINKFVKNDKIYFILFYKLIV
jgi:hypothetical protein